MSAHPKFDAFKARVLADPVARAAYYRSRDSRPRRLPIDGREYRRRQKARS